MNEFRGYKEELTLSDGVIGQRTFIFPNFHFKRDKNRFFSSRGRVIIVGPDLDLPSFSLRFSQGPSYFVFGRQ
jgi:hypothetical protein